MAVTGKAIAKTRDGVATKGLNPPAFLRRLTAAIPNRLRRKERRAWHYSPPRFSHDDDRASCGPARRAVGAHASVVPWV